VVTLVASVNEYADYLHVEAAKQYYLSLHAISSIHQPPFFRCFHVHELVAVDALHPVANELTLLSTQSSAVASLSAHRCEDSEPTARSNQSSADCCHLCQFGAAHSTHERESSD
jgi:hypothetical protein